MESCYESRSISERHRHRYEFNNDYREVLTDCGLTLSGTSPDGPAFFARCAAPAPSGEGQYFADVLQIPRLAAFEPSCGCSRTPKDVY